MKPIPLSGQDATGQGVQNIISGWQTMTVYKQVPKEANAAAKAAVQLLKGQKLTTTVMASGSRKNTASTLASGATCQYGAAAGAISRLRRR